MKQLSRSVTPLLAMLVLASHASAQSGPDEQYWNFLRGGTRTVLSAIKTRLGPTLSTHDKSVVDAITFQIRPVEILNAYASRSQGQRKVVIFVGYLVAIDQLTTAYVAEHEVGLPGCYEEYANNLLRAIGPNTQEAAMYHAPSHGVPTVWTLGLSSSSKCHGLDRGSFGAHPGAGATYGKMVEASLSFMILHEIAHHVLGHVDIPDAEMTNEASRSNETAADAWAVDKGIKIKVNPAAGMASWIFFSALDGTDLTQETTHPLSARRLNAMWDYVKAQSKTDEYTQIFGAPIPQSSINEIDEVVRQVRAQLHS